MLGQKTPIMPIDLSTQEREEALNSIKRFAREELELELTNLKAQQILAFALQEIGPLAYNQGVREAEGMMRRQMEDLSATVFQAPFTYWQAKGKRSGRASSI
jgi:uncharacterized protein (DUF2164 family)